MTTYNDTDVMTAEALAKLLRDTRQKAATLYSYLTMTISDVEGVHSGAEFIALGRDVRALDLLTSTAMSQADDVVGMIRGRIARIEQEEPK